MSRWVVEPWSHTLFLWFSHRTNSMTRPLRTRGPKQMATLTPTLVSPLKNCACRFSGFLLSPWILIVNGHSVVICCLYCCFNIFWNRSNVLDISAAKLYGASLVYDHEKIKEKNAADIIARSHFCAWHLHVKDIKTGRFLKFRIDTT